MQVEWTDDPESFSTRDWTAIVHADPDGTLFHTPRYLRIFWEELGEGDLRLAFVRDGDETVGAAAFSHSRGTLAFLGGFEVTDYMGPVAAPEARERVAKELMRSIAERDDWETADLRGLLRHGGWPATLLDAAGDAGLRAEAGDDGAAALLRLPDSFDAYLESLPGKLRHEVRRKARRLHEALPGARVVDAVPETAERDLAAFVAMHRQSEGAKGSFMSSERERFFRRLTKDLLPDGTFRLSFLEADGVRVAATVGFRDRERFLLYNSAFDRKHRALSPGIVMITELIRGAVGSGVEAFDLLKGDLSYKYRFGARPRHLVRLTLHRR